MIKQILRVVQLYEERGYHVRTGLSPWHFRCNLYLSLPMSSVFRRGQKLSVGGGLSLVEMFFFAALCQVWKPSRILVIGNAFGLSSVLLSVLNPAAKVVALDKCTEGVDNEEGNRLTKQIAEEEQLNLQVVIGSSPQDVPSVVSQYLDDIIDLIFVDGLHTNEQQKNDFDACWKIMGENAVYCLHDVLNYKMEPTFKLICSEHPEMRNAILYRTVSGMGCLYSQVASSRIEGIIGLYTEPEEIIEITRREIRVERWMAYLPMNALSKAIPASLRRKIRRKLYA